MKEYLVVAYDIADNKRRTRICDILLGYGHRVNYSVFECFLEKKEITKLKSKIKRSIKRGEDIILYYNLCKDCLDKIERIGKFPDAGPVVKVF